MAWRSLGDVNEDMVQNFKRVLSKEVENAFLTIPRAAFLPEDLLDQIYSDSPIHGEGHLRMSAPHIYAAVLEALDLKAGMSFLNVGSGTGYLSMLVGYLIGPGGTNHGIEVRGNIVEHAHECCEEFLMYTPKLKKQISYPQFIVGNCFHIDTKTQQYDRVYVGAGCPPNLVYFFLSLLKPDGFVIVPSDNKVLKIVNVSPHGTKETVLSDVCFEGLVLPDENAQTHPKLRFAGAQLKTKKIKVYPPPGLLVPKNPARKLLARLRALQDVVDCFAHSLSLPTAFAFVPSFAQISQLSKKSKSDRSHAVEHIVPPPVEQTIKFFHSKLTEKKPEVIFKEKLTAADRECEKFWNDLQGDTIWENMLDYTYSLSNGGTEGGQKCVDVYIKVKTKRSKKISADLSNSNSKKGLTTSRNKLENFERLSNELQASLGAVVKCKKDEILALKSKDVNDLNLKDNSVLAHGDETRKRKSPKSDLKYDETCKLKPHERVEVVSDLVRTKKNATVYKGGMVSRRLCPIEVDMYESSKLALPPGLSWTSDQDGQLVQLLIDSLGVSTTKMNSKCLGKNISILPSIFSTAVLVRYPKLSAYSQTALTYRALALFRVVHVIDYVISYLCGTLPTLQSVTRPSTDQSYPLASFTDGSFEGPNQAPQKFAEEKWNAKTTKKAPPSLKTELYEKTTALNVTCNSPGNTLSPDELIDFPNRFNASSILSNLKFLLPLSTRRMGILTELLRATEQPFSDQVPVLYIDRRVSLVERLRDPRKSVFYQLYEEFKGQNMNFRCNKRKCDQWWEVKFVGEGIIDQGGGFRDSLAELSDELCPREANITCVLPLFVRSANQRDHTGEYRDCFVPNPSYNDASVYYWLGMLMGAAYRSDESLTLSFPPFIWKLLVGEYVTWCTDFFGVDEASVKLINRIESMTEEDFVAFNTVEIEFTTALSDGKIVDVIENGSHVQVNNDNRLKYCELVRKTRMMECVEQVKAMRDGLLSVVPESLLELITYQELERGVCGFDEISLPLLKESIHYGDELSAESDCVVQLWKVLENFDMEDRSRFLRFVCGRKRLPAFVTLSHMCGEKDSLPSASTCASTLMLPTYSSVEVAEKKLRYCVQLHSTVGIGTFWLICWWYSGWCIQYMYPSLL